MEKVAVKKVDFKTIEKDPYLERAIHYKFKHPNIVQLMEVLNSKRSLYIIMQYCKDGDLKKYLKKKEKEGLPEPEAIGIMKQIVRGYQELARNNTIHRDLKPANILISNGYFKICDFGFSKVIKDPTVANKTCVGSPIYMAPRILDKKDYSAKCDIWSLGIIFYELLHGLVPWTAKSERQLLSKIKTESFPCPKATPQTQKMIRKMIQVSEQKRASIHDLEAFFTIQPDQFQPIASTSPLWQQKSKPSVLEPSVQAKVLNRNCFEQLAWRYYVCVQLRTNLPFLNRFNFKQNVFERYIVLLITSIISSLKKKKSDIDRIHQKQAILKIKQQTDVYLQFQKDYYQYLNQGYATCQILKEFDLTDIASGNYNEQSTRRAQSDLVKNSQIILKQLREEIKLNQSQESQRIALMEMSELVLDMILLNQRQARTGAAQIDIFLVERSTKPIQKRLSQKFSALKQVKRTQFY